MSALWSQFLIVALMLGFTACASTHEVLNRYQSAIGDKKTSPRTTFVLLVDGLPVRTLQTLLQAGELPNFRKFYLQNSSQIYQARSVFPSLTYPNLVSLITESSVENHGIFGNKVFMGGQFFDFESPSTHRFLNEHIEGRNVFARLAKKGLRTLAIGYNFWTDTTAATYPNDIEAGGQIWEKNYDKVDTKLIASLQAVLDNTPVNQWPDFIFMHLIGLDFTSHDFGPDSPQAHAYLRQLDSRLGSVLRTLAVAEARSDRQIISLLTADHGFAKNISKLLDVRELLPESYGVQVQNEGRLVSLIFPNHWSTEERARYFETVKFSKELAFKAIRVGDQVLVDCETHRHRFPLVGPLPQDWEYPELTESLARYFRAAEPAGMVLVANAGIALTDSYNGFHGGITPEEMTIPLLLRNAKPRDSSRLPYIYELLGFL